MAQINLPIGGFHYPVSCRDGEEAHLTRLGESVAQKVSEAKAAVGNPGEVRQLLFRGGLPVAPKTSEGITAITAQLREFVAAISQNRDPTVGGADGKLALLLTGATYQSLVDKQPVHLQRGQYESIA